MSDQAKYTQKLKGKKVLITGGTSGIGYAVAEAVLEAGASAIVASSSQDKVDKTIASLQKAYPSAKDKISGYTCDLSTAEALEDNIKALLDKCGGKLDHIVHTAGDRLADKPLGEASLQFMQQAGMVRYFAPLMIAKHAKQYLNDSNESSFTITTGSTGEKPLPGWSIISSYASGLFGMTKALAIELAPIRVNLVSPGIVATELWDHLGAENKQKQLDAASARTLTRKAASPEDIAECYLYFMKDTNVTGTSISSNGGATLV